MTPEQQTRIERMTKAATAGTYDQWDKGDVLFLLEVLAEAQESNRRLEASRDQFERDLAETHKALNLQIDKTAEQTHKYLDLRDAVINTAREVCPMECPDSTNWAIELILQTLKAQGDNFVAVRQEADGLIEQREQRAADVRALCEHVIQAMYYVSSESLLKKLDEAVEKVKEWGKDL